MILLATENGVIIGPFGPSLELNIYICYIHLYQQYYAFVTRLGVFYYVFVTRLGIFYDVFLRY